MTKFVKRDKTNTVYFVTFTCFKWIALVELANAYNAFYKWFEYLKTNNIPLLGYVIMPNHFHCLIYLPADSETTLNRLVSNAKRFIAYAIIQNLEEAKSENLLQLLLVHTSEKRKTKGQKHRVFIDSFDAKEVYSQEMLEVKLDYIHRNPCSGKWNLAENFVQYPHSSASFYELEKQNEYLTHYREIW